MARRGIDLMRGERAGLSAGMEARERELRAFEVRAQCSVAEICLGCIEESESIEVARRMDSEVERAVMEALALCGEGGQGEVEALVALANLRLSQGRRDEAKSAMGRVFSLMEGGLKLLEGEHVPDDRVVAALKALPGLEVRIAVGKQLVEVDMWMEGIVVLMSVMWECDFNVEVWYLLAVAYWKLGDFDEAKSALESTRQVLRNAQGYEGELEEHMIDKLYKELHVTNPLTPSMTD